MTSITLIVSGAKIQAEVNGVLTSGMVGIPVFIKYDEAWDGLIKNLVCRCGQWAPARGETRTILNIGSTATVAHEIMQAETTLFLGIEGYNADGSLVIPTTWANCGYIHPGANANADPSAEPDLPLWAQLQAQITQLQESSVSEEEMEAAIEKYLEENPIEIPDVSQNPGLTAAQITALNEMFKVCAFIKEDVSAEYAAFKAAFGISDSGEVHTHTYTSAVTTAAACTTAGVRTYTCSCGASYTESIPATGHNYVDGTCTVCGAADPNYIPGITLTRITAVYSGGDVAAGTDVSDLTGIVVTAYYSNGTTAIKTDYTLSGTIAEGENTITVSYGGQATTFTVTGIAESSELPQYDYTVAGNYGLNADGTAYPSTQYNCTDFIDIDSNYSTFSVATYLDEVSDTRISSNSYVQWFNGDTFLSRVGESPVIEIGNIKCTKPVTHAVPEGATKFRVCVQNNCDRFVLYKGTVSASDI